MSIGNIASIISSVLVIISFILSIRKLGGKLKNIVNGQQCQLRSDITAIYYRHSDFDEPTLREYERKNLDDLYDAYKALGGNHYVDDIYKTMREWRVTK